MIVKDLIVENVKMLEDCNFCGSICEITECSESVMDEEKLARATKELHKILGDEYNIEEITQLFRMIYALFHGESDSSFTDCDRCREEITICHLCSGDCNESIYKRFMKRLTRENLNLAIEDL